jgi:hypothetical protein
MADSIYKSITLNLQTALDNKTFVYAGASHVSTCELQRFNRAPSGRYPFIELSGPQVEVVSRHHDSTHCKLYYLIEFREARINDEYIGENDIVKAVTEVEADVVADLQKLVLADITRGGKAMNTNWDDFGHYFEIIGDVCEFVVFQVVEVETMVNTNNPYAGG